MQSPPVLGFESYAALSYADWLHEARIFLEVLCIDSHLEARIRFAADQDKWFLSPQADIAFLRRALEFTKHVNFLIELDEILDEVAEWKRRFVSAKVHLSTGSGLI